MGQMIICMFSHLETMAEYYTEYHKQFVLSSGIDSGADNVHNWLCNNIMVIMTGNFALLLFQLIGFLYL